MKLARLLLFLAATAVALGAQSPPPDQPVLPRALEVELALNAAPAHLREGAAVLVFEHTGYVKVRETSNGFTCLVSRRGGDFFPVCWDAEGARTLLPIELEAATLRLGGTSNAEIERKVADGFKDGSYRPPSRGGVAYMLSPLRYRIDERGIVTNSNPAPHVMFYGPGLTDADIGGQRGSPVFMNRVGPDGMIIVPVGTAERQAIRVASQSLIERVERELGVKAPQ